MVMLDEADCGAAGCGLLCHILVGLLDRRYPWSCLQVVGYWSCWTRSDRGSETEPV